MNNDESASATEQFGVSTEHVEGDDLVSHVLASLGSSVDDRKTVARAIDAEHP